VKAHVEVGAEIVACLGDPELTAIVRHHHERFDGTGYPSGVAYEQIPLGARIIAVADTFDALTSVRPYRPAASHKQALEALAKASGSQLDPAAVRAFLRCYSGNKAIVFWALLTVSPQHLLAWLGEKRPPSSNASLGSMSATIGAIPRSGSRLSALRSGQDQARTSCVRSTSRRAARSSPRRLRPGPASREGPRIGPSITRAPRRRHTVDTLRNSQAVCPLQLGAPRSLLLGAPEPITPAH
jgi:hypothetical protein